MIKRKDLVMTAIIGFESSCDETAVAVVVDGRKVLSNAIASQIAKHAVYGGVIPELAAREHLSAIRRVTDEALKDAGIPMDEIKAVAVTNGPGLVPALLVGLNFAKGFAAAYQKPIIGINHFLGHIYGVFLDQEEDIFAKKELFPMIGLVVSGGHTALVLIQSNGEVAVVGQKEHSLRIVVEPPDGIHPARTCGQKIHHGFPSAFVVYRTDIPLRLIHQIVLMLRVDLNRNSVYENFVFVFIHVVAQGGGFAVDRHFSVGDQLIAGAAACNAALRQKFIDSHSTSSVV